jgi:hypothetical protein
LLSAGACGFRSRVTLDSSRVTKLLTTIDKRNLVSLLPGFSFEKNISYFLKIALEAKLRLSSSLATIAAKKKTSSPWTITKQTDNHIAP